MFPPFFIFPSSLIFHNMSSMQAVASSAVSWPHTEENSYKFHSLNKKDDNTCSLYILHSSQLCRNIFSCCWHVKFGCPLRVNSLFECDCWVKALVHSKSKHLCETLGAHVDPPLSWMILLRYSAVRLLRVSLCGGPRRWGKTTEVSTTVPWSNYSKQEESYSSKLFCSHVELIPVFKKKQKKKNWHS